MRMRIWTLLIPAILVLAATPAWAAEGAEESGRGLMDVSTAELVAALVTFFVLVFLLGKLAWKPILGSLQQREATIQKALDDAAKANEQALALLQQYEGKMEEAKADAQAIADGARKEAETARQRIETDARERAEETLRRSLREIEQATESALDDVLPQVGDLASEAAARLVRRELSPTDHASIVDAVIKAAARTQGSSSR